MAAWIDFQLHLVLLLIYISAFKIPECLFTEIICFNMADVVK